MNQKLIFNALGMNFKKLLNEHSFPSIDSTIFSSQHCTKIRSNLYAMPKNDVKLKDKMVHLLHQGEIEEVRDKNGSYIFLLHIRYKSEYYLVELKLENYKWSFLTIHFVGESSKTNKKWIAGAFIIAILIISVISVVLTKPSLTANSTVHAPSHLDGNKLIDGVVGGKANSEEFIHMQATIENLKYQLAMEKDTQISVKKPSIGDPSSTEVVITIVPGMKSSDITTLLVETGLARSEAEIKQLFTELEVHKKLRSGSFTIPLDATYLEIIKIITKR